MELNPYDGAFDVGVNDIKLVDNHDLLQGASLRIVSGNGWTTSNFGNLGNYEDRNGDGFDFFVFERSGNDTLNARARYFTDGGVTFTLGNQALIATADNSSQWGDTDYENPVNPPSGTQNVYGTAFKVTDLLDASGSL